MKQKQAGHDAMLSKLCGYDKQGVEALLDWKREYKEWLKQGKPDRIGMIWR